MRVKTLKLELFTFFFVTLASFVAFYGDDYLPDSFYSISSASQDISFLGYYFATIVRGVCYYSGPWILAPFFIFLLLYAFLYSKRSLKWDCFNCVPLLGAIIFLTYFLYPEFLGRGLFYFLSEYTTPIWAASSLFVFTIVFVGGTFRGTFKDSMLTLFRGLGKILAKCFSFKIKWSNPFRFFANIWIKTVTKVKNVFWVLVPRILKKKKCPEIQESQENKDANDDDDDEQDIENEIVDMEAILTNPTMVVLPNKNNKNSKNNKSKNNKAYHSLASLGIQKRNASADKNPDAEYFEQIIQKFEEKFQEFGVNGKIVNILKGPVVDTFEVGLGLGVLVSKVTKIENELSIALSGTPLRIVYPLTGKTTIGIEVPRNPRQFIYLDEVISHKTFQNAGHRLPIAMGKDTFGEAVCVDLAKMPHMLIAGSTGAGKSVFINTLLVSLLVKRSPKEMKLILIDPKQLELALYSQLPHLIMPVITEPKLTNVALLWAIQEMEKRYKLIGDLNVRNIDSFNEKVKNATPEMLAKIHHYYDDNAENGYELPYIVIIVDEYADLILAKEGKEIERGIAKLAAKARASGIHLVVATQRPSVDVITGVIKSNFPTRVSFRVTSNADSRTILDTVGAEKLLGNGDMLYKYATSTTRLHSSFISDEEIEAFTEQISGIPQEFNEKAVNFLEAGGEQDEESGQDNSRRAQAQKLSEKDEKIFWEAVDLCIEYRQVSTSFLQRHLALGFPKAAKITDELERRGVIGPRQGASMRKVIINSPSEITAP